MVQPLPPSSCVMLETSNGNLLNHDNTTLQTEELVNRKERDWETKKEIQNEKATESYSGNNTRNWIEKLPSSTLWFHSKQSKQPNVLKVFVKSCYMFSKSIPYAIMIPENNNSSHTHTHTFPYWVNCISTWVVYEMCYFHIIIFWKLWLMFFLHFSPSFSVWVWSRRGGGSCQSSATLQFSSNIHSTVKASYTICYISIPMHNCLHIALSTMHFLYFAFIFFYVSILFYYFILLNDYVSMCSTLSPPRVWKVLNNWSCLALPLWFTYLNCSIMGEWT